MSGSAEDGSQRAALANTFASSFGMFTGMGTPVNVQDTLRLRRQQREDLRKSRAALTSSGASMRLPTQDALPMERGSQTRSPQLNVRSAEDFEIDGDIPVDRIRLAPNMLDLAESKGINPAFLRARFPKWQNTWDGSVPNWDKLNEPALPSCKTPISASRGLTPQLEPLLGQEVSGSRAPQSLVPELMNLISERGPRPKGPGRTRGLGYSPSEPVLIGGRLQHGWQYR